MQLHQLAYFVAVAQEGSFTRAAELANVAQPSLSQQIKALETDLGAQLVHRARGKVGLTAAGETLLPVARRMLADAETARREIRELAALGRGRVRLGATPSLCTGLLPAVLAGYRRDHPGVDLVVHESGSRDLEKSLLEGTLDLALVIDASLGDDPELATVPLLTEELVVISRHGDPGPTRRSRMSIAELEGVPLVMFRTGYDLRESTVAACRAAGFEPTFAIEGGEMDAVLEFVQAGLGVAVVPSTVVRGRFTVTSISTPGLRRTVLLALRRGLEPPRAAQVLIESLTEFLRSTALPAATAAVAAASPAAKGSAR
ncbi:LysR family transcriptional regulator [Actinospica durhamensis]|uniref:LysR family transcriptional regulator n=1 Tax=Actinospica durhamensis TaxID=1508375 RepID=A0A941IT23_9ACTN|nr:LysR substrate-binding domain-containing protein [Actinospica durhamensis]MBR7833876.1 LysR family transcriptional regulator [Actinospica durhamensis]